MRRLGRQAARHAVALALTGLAVCALALGGAAWLASAHPIPAPWLAARAEAAAADTLGPGGRFHVGAAFIGWDGFRLGFGVPLEVRFDDVAWRTHEGVAGTADRLEVRLEILPLLRGALRPRALRLTGAMLRVTPAAKSRPAAENGAGDSALAALRGIAGGVGLPAWAADLRFAALEGAALAVGEGPPMLSDIDATLSRGATGVFALTAQAALPPGGVSGRIGAPARASLHAELDPGLRPLAAQADLEAGAGRLRLAGPEIGISDAAAHFAWEQEGRFAASAALTLAPRSEVEPTRLALTAEGRGDQAGAAGRVRLELDQVAFADLGALWPEWLAPNPRRWVLENITAGTARDGRVILDLSSAGPGPVQVIAAQGALQGSDLTVHWLRPVPPVEHGQARLALLGPDALQIDIAGGVQPAGPAGQSLQVQGGSVAINGLSARDQAADIRLHVAGRVPAALALLSQPRLHLLADHPVALSAPRGEVSADLAVQMPLDERVTIEQVGIGVTARLSGFGASAVAAGQDLQDATLDLSAGPDGITFQGTGRIGGIPARLGGAMDFRAGPPGQVVQRITVAARPEIAALTQLGVDAQSIARGRADIALAYARTRRGDAAAELQADLAGAELHLAPLGWRKPQGAPGMLKARLIMGRGERLERIERIAAEGAGFSVSGHAAFAPGGAATLTLERVRLGGTEGQGTLVFAPNGGGIRASLSGPVLDLGGRFARGTQSAAERPAEGGRWTIAARFARAVLAHGRAVGGLALEASGEGDRIGALRLHAGTRPIEEVAASITPVAGGRALRVTAADGGALLAALGALDDVEGGRLLIDGRFDDSRPDHLLSGLAELDGFRLRGAPLLAKALQAASLYGLVQALERPGMGFTHLVAPFAYADERISLRDARAFNPSLGVTAEGEIDLARERLKLEGTIVPAYYLNTLPGRIPLIGRLFSPEKGGGLIAARFAAAGPLSDPAVTVNPLSALTPGFLRGLFGK